MRQYVAYIIVWVKSLWLIVALRWNAFSWTAWYFPMVRWQKVVLYHESVYYIWKFQNMSATILTNLLFYHRESVLMPTCPDLKLCPITINIVLKFRARHNWWIRIFHCRCALEIWDLLLRALSLACPVNVREKHAWVASWGTDEHIKLCIIFS